jgi:glycosyltransferase involved in cell wall biosynthesis
MKIVLFGGFTKRKHGISRVVQELARSLLLQKEIDALTIVTPHDEDFVDPSIVMDERVSVHPLVAFEGFLNFSQQLEALKENFLKIIQLYKRNDIFLLCSLPSGRAFARIPVGGILLVLTLSKWGFLPKAKTVQVLYDFIPYLFPEVDSDGRIVALFNTYKKHFSTMPEKYIAISESTKNDAIRYWNLSADRIAVISLGSFIAPKSPRADFGSKQILMVSDIAPHKNHLRLLKAFELVYGNDCEQAELLIVGHERIVDPQFRSTLTDIRERNKKIKITECGCRTDAEITALYEQVDVFVYPSLYEGFGLPVLEAMACGCPVITSNISSLPDVAGEAGLLVDPYNVEELAQAIITVLNDDELKRVMSRRSIAQAQKFSWEKTGEQCLAVCNDVFRGSNKYQA